MKSKLIAAFEATCQKFSPDRVVADPELNAAFLAECSRLGLTGSAATLNRGADFRQCLLEAAAGVLKASVQGQQLLQELPAQQMNLVAAVWSAEASSLDAQPNSSGENFDKRREWSDTIRRAIPSCFCNVDLLE